MSVILVQPTKAIGRNEMPFVRDTHVATIVLGGGPGSPQEGDIWGQNPYSVSRREH